MVVPGEKIDIREDQWRTIEDKASFSPLHANGYRQIAVILCHYSCTRGIKPAEIVVDIIPAIKILSCCVQFYSCKFQRCSVSSSKYISTFEEIIIRGNIHCICEMAPEILGGNKDCPPSIDVFKKDFSILFVGTKSGCNDQYIIFVLQRILYFIHREIGTMYLMAIEH